MPEGTTDDRGDVTGGGPEGTTAPASEAAAQGAGGGTPAAPAEGKTADDVIQMSPPAETDEKGGAGDDEVAKLKDKVGYLQPAYDEKSQALKAVQELHPEFFDADGKLVGTQQAKDEEPVLHLGGQQQAAAGEGQRPPAQPAPVGPQAAVVDPAQALWDKINQVGLSQLYTGGPDGQGDLVAAMNTVFPQLLAEHGITPEALAQRGGGGITQEQFDQAVDQRVVQRIAQHEQEVASFENQLEYITAQCGPELLAQQVKFADTPQQTLKDALPRIMAETGVGHPLAALLAHGNTGAVTLNALVDARATEKAEAMVRGQSGEQLMDVGGGLPGVGGVVDDMEEIGGSYERPVAESD